MGIKRLRISGFKSIEDVTLSAVTTFSVFAGANGAGKSNLFDAICFASTVTKIGAIDAIRQFGGYGQIHCYKKRGSGARTYSFSIEIDLEDTLWQYDLEIKKMDSVPVISERLRKNDGLIFERKDGGAPLFEDSKDSFIPEFPGERSALMFAFHTPVYRWLSNVRVYRIDPINAKKPDDFNTDNSELDAAGSNVATMLASYEKNEDFRETILEWMEMIAPGLRRISTEQLKLEGRTALKFTEDGTKAQFPANLISDGTIYVLCILTAIMTRSKELGLTLIEEPERGINPKAIAQIVELMRDKSSNAHPVWVTTHNETVVRSTRPEELILVNKEDGRTVFRYGRDAADTVGDMPMDKAWLSNLFGGGLPW